MSAQMRGCALNRVDTLAIWLNHVPARIPAQRYDRERRAMSRIYLGVICGLVFGGLDTAMMIPLSFPDKRAALLGAFIARFGLGFVICNVKLPWPGWIVGLLLGILLSLPDAIITKAMIPILVSGAIGGVIIGIIAAKFGS